MALHLKSTGIDFADFGHGSGSMTSELLDDYEEGTWQMAYDGTTGTAGTYTANNDPCHYTKTGRNIWISMSTYITNLGSWTGNFQVTGLPFTGIGIAGMIVIMYPSNTAVDANMRAAGIVGGQTIIRFRTGAALDGTANWSEITTGRYLQASGDMKI